MKQKVILCITTTALLLGVASVALPATPAGAIDVFSGSGCSSGGGQGGAAAPANGGTQGANGGSAGSSKICGAATQDDLPRLIKNVINILLFLVGIIAVIAIVIGGLRYATSNGDSSQIKSAKDTILYAVVGLIVAILSYAIVNFVVAAFS
jgi:hypothetical protein